MDVLTCAACGGSMRLIALIKDPEALARICVHMGWRASAPECDSARLPPQLTFDPDHDPGEILSPETAERPTPMLAPRPPSASTPNFVSLAAQLSHHATPAPADPLSSLAHAFDARGAPRKGRQHALGDETCLLSLERNRFAVERSPLWCVTHDPSPAFADQLEQALAALESVADGS